MSIKNRLAMLVGSLALATTALVGPGVAPAAAAGAPDTAAAEKVADVTQATASGWANLEIYQFGDGTYWITVSGRDYRPSSTPKSLAIKIYGDDTFFDTYIFDRFWYTPNADGSFYIEFPLCCSALNEDWGQDEIYATASLWDKTNGSMVLKTNVVTGYF